MALHNNTPANGKIYIENLVITQNNIPYAVNNVYTDKNYIYWNIDEPNDLFLSDVRNNDSNLILIIKNVNGNGIKMYNENLKMVFDNFDKDKLIEKIKSVEDYTDEYKTRLNNVSLSIETLSETLKQSEDISDMKEQFNTMVINYNSSLIQLSSSLSNYLTDSSLNEYEKSDLKDKSSVLSSQIIQVLARGDVLTDRYVSYGFTEEKSSANAIIQYKVTLENQSVKLSEYIDILVTSTDNEIANNDTTAFVYSLISDMISSLSSYKDACGDLFFLGAGNTIPDESSLANNRIDKVIRNVESLQNSLLGSMDDEKEEIQNSFSLIQTYSNKIVVIINGALTKKGTLTSEESQTIRTLTEMMKNVKNNIEVYYQSYQGNNSLQESDKNQLKEYHDNFISNLDDFYNKLKGFVSDYTIDSNESKEFTVMLSTHRQTRELYLAKMLSCANYVKDNASLEALQQIRDDVEVSITQIKQEIQDAIKEIKTCYDEKIIELEQRLDALEGSSE